MFHTEAFILRKLAEDMIIFASFADPLGMSVTKVGVGSVGAMIVIGAGIIVGIEGRSGLSERQVIAIESQPGAARTRHRSLQPEPIDALGVRPALNPALGLALLNSGGAVGLLRATGGKPAPPGEILVTISRRIP